MKIKLKHKKEFAKLAIPLMIGSILQILMGTVDMIFISRLGKEYASASAMGNSISGVIFILAMLIASGSIALVSRRRGEGDVNGVKTIAGTSIFLALILGGALSIVTSFFAKDIIQIMKPSISTSKIILDYLSVIFSFTFVVFLNTTMRNVIQATGNTKIPVIILGCANILNMILDYIFIVELNYGIKGAAVATVTSQVLGSIAMLLVVINNIYGNSIKEFFAYFKIRITEAKSILNIGKWACLQSVARPITGLIMMRIIYEVGKETASAAFGIGLVLINYFFIVLLGLSGAVTIMVGHKLGEKKIKEAKEIVKEGIVYSFINILFFLIPYGLLTKYLFIPFNASEEVVKLGSEYIWSVAVGFVVIGYTFMYRGAFAGAGDTFPPMIAALFANVVCKLAVAFVSTQILGFGVIGVWAAITISIYIEVLILHIFYKKGDLYKKVI